MIKFTPSQYRILDLKISYLCMVFQDPYMASLVRERFNGSECVKVFSSFFKILSSLVQ